jgi:polysaccharide biosynthesis transport protein
LDAALRDYAEKADVVDRLLHRIGELKLKVAQEELERVGLRELERRADANSDLYRSYLKQAREAAEASRWHPIAARIVAQANPPAHPDFPNFHLLVPVGGIGCAFGAMLIGALVELRRQKRVFSGPLGFSGEMGMQVVGVVPWVRRPIAPELPEKFKIAIENVTFRLFVPTDATLTHPTAVAVTSAVPNEGKSVLAVSLARQFLEDGARVAIVDADMRRPSVLDAVRLLRDRAVTAVSCAPDGTQWDGAGRGGLHVLTLADMAFSAAEILSALPRMISNLKQHYDVVIVDTPPLLEVSDALATVPSCDRILFAVEWCATSRRAVEFALGELSDSERGRTRIVLTKVAGGGYAQYGAAASRQYRPRAAGRRVAVAERRAS